MKKNFTGVFIDGDYLNLVLRREFNSVRIDLLKFSNLIIPDEMLIYRTYYYKSPPYIFRDANEEFERLENFDRFIHSIKKLSRFRVREAEIFRSPDGQYSIGDLNILLTTDATFIATERKVNQITIISSNLDLLPLIRTISEMGIIIVIYHGGEIPYKINIAADETIRIDEHLIEQSSIISIPQSR